MFILIFFYLLAWKRNHEQLTTSKNAQIIGASQNVKEKNIFNPKPGEVSPKNHERDNLQKNKHSDRSMRKMQHSNAEINDYGSSSSSTNSSFSSVASIRKKTNNSNSKNQRKLDTPSPQIPPRAPVLETLKRTKRELVNKHSNKKVEHSKVSEFNQ